MTEHGSHFEDYLDQEGDVSPESIPGHIFNAPQELLDIYTPRERDRVRVFQNMVGKVYETNNDLRKGHKDIGWGPVTPQGNVTERWMTLDGRFSYIWSQVAWDMYQKEFEGNPKMEAAAQAIVDFNRERYDEGEKAMTQDEVERLIERE